MIHEYAGFRYRITVDEGQHWAAPLPGQHRAANKEKHRRAAVDTFLQAGGDLL